MKKMIALLLVACMMLALVACNTPAPNNPTDPKPSQTDSKPTDPKPSETDPKPSETDPKPTENPWPDGRIVIEAEKPTDKYVDLVDRNDMGGNPMYQPGNQPHSARPVAEDGLQYCVRSTTRIVFCAYDWYTYTVEVKEAGTYSFAVLASCDRDTPIVVYVDGAETPAGTGIFNEHVDGYGTDNYSRYDESYLITLELTAGTHTIKVAIEEEKNHNFWVDCYYLIPANEG